MKRLNRLFSCIIILSVCCEILMIPLNNSRSLAAENTKNVVTMYKKENVFIHEGRENSMIIKKVGIKRYKKSMGEGNVAPNLGELKKFKVKSGPKGTVTFTWKKIDHKYEKVEIQASLSLEFDNDKILSINCLANRGILRNIVGLERGKIYYFRARVFEGEYYSKWTKTVSVKIDDSRYKPTFVGNKKIKKTYTRKKFNLEVKTDSDGKLSYSTSNKKVATVDNKGMVFVQGYGKAIITVKTKATKEFEAGEKKITIIIVPDKVKKFSAKSLSNGRVKFTWKKVKVKNAKCQIQASTSKDFPDEFTKVVNPCPDLQRGKFIADGLKSGKTYYFRARVVVKVSGKNYCSVWSEKKIKIR